MDAGMRDFAAAWMRHCALVLLAALTTSADGAASAPPPPEAFGTLPVQTDVQLSPNGRWLAWTDNSQAKPHVVMFDLEARKVQRLMAVPEKTKIRDLAWNDDETLLITVSETDVSHQASETSDEYFRVIAQDTSGGAGRMLPMSVNSIYHYSEPPLARLISRRTPKPHTVIMAVGECKHVIASCLVEVDTRTGNGTVLKVGNEFTSNWAVDRDGHARARVDWDYHKHAYRVLALHTDPYAGDSVTEILRRDDSDPPHLAGLLADGSALVLLSSNGLSHRAAWTLPLDGSPLKLLAEDAEADITGTYSDPYTGAIIGVYASGTKTMVHWIDPAAQHRYEVVQNTFPGRQISVYEWTADGTKTIAKVETSSTPPVYYLVNFARHRAEIAAEEYPALTGVPLGEFQETSYTSRHHPEKRQPTCRWSYCRTAGRGRATTLGSAGWCSFWRRAATLCCSRSSAVPLDSATRFSRLDTVSGAASCRMT